MNEEENQAIEFLKHSLYEEIDTSVLKYIDKNHKIIYKLILKQQKEIEKLKDEYKREVFEHQEFVEDTKVAVQDYIKKDEIREKMRGEINKSWRNTEQRKCQLYAYDILKELIGE